MITRILNWILKLMGSQCKDIRNVVTWDLLGDLVRSIILDHCITLDGDNFKIIYYLHEWKQVQYKWQRTRNCNWEGLVQQVGEKTIQSWSRDTYQLPEPLNQYTGAWGSTAALRSNSLNTENSPTSLWINRSFVSLKRAVFVDCNRQKPD